MKYLIFAVIVLLLLIYFDNDSFSTDIDSSNLPDQFTKSDRLILLNSYSNTLNTSVFYGKQY